MGPIAKNRTDGILIQHNIEDLEKEVHLGRSRPAEGNQAIKRITVPLGTQEIAVTSPLQTVSGNDGNLTADGNEDNSQETGATLRDKSSGQRKTNTTKTASLLKMTSSKKNVQRGGSFKMSHIVVAVCGCLAAYLALKLYPQFLARVSFQLGLLINQLQPRIISSLHYESEQRPALRLGRIIFLTL